MEKTSVFVCYSAKFGTNYPKLTFGPGFDPTLEDYPSLGLYTATESTAAIVTNSINLKFKTSIDLPDPGANSYYRIKVKIGGNQYTVVPLSTIYEDLPVMTGYSRSKYSILLNSSDKDMIIIDYVGLVSSLKTYTIGFKIALDGSEVSGNKLKFFGSDAFGALSIYHFDGASETEVLKITQPNATLPDFQKLTNNDWSNLGTNLPTLIHTLPYSAIDSGTKALTTATDMTNIVSANLWGVEVGTDLILFLQADFDTSNFGNLASATQYQTYIELITHKDITVTAKSTSVWGNMPSDAQNSVNCAIYDNSAA